MAARHTPFDEQHVERLRTPLTAEQRAECGSFRLTPTVRRGWETTLACARLLEATGGKARASVSASGGRTRDRARTSGA